MSTDIAPVFKFSKTLSAASADVIEAWLRGRNEKTKRGYLSDICQFSTWAKAVIPCRGRLFLRMGPGGANRVVMTYRADMVEAGLSSSTINRRLARCGAWSRSVA